MKLISNDVDIELRKMQRVLDEKDPYTIERRVILATRARTRIIRYKENLEHALYRSQF